MSNLRDGLESIIHFGFPALGGLIAVVIINLNPEALMNPMIWIPLGIFLGWAVARVALKYMSKFH
ncbi:hypothetical protein [Aliiroseovarius crassostreae]|uniref:hypothetical protein n=1 Tax=Aliiroseovarius crassostreae TaxID=154981 RepID=UPI0022049CC9|nr:hypothetical protein [Aliiroseovarius crassostreae]UWP90347.1 hypothetical protein K3J57_06680 [Aliiroseovarius crassostreae]UWQ03010.1 hypothetical protein K3X44_06745 [Aliiroseovarius crassostreae]